MNRRQLLQKGRIKYLTGLSFLFVLLLTPSNIMALSPSDPSQTPSGNESTAIAGGSQAVNTDQSTISAASDTNTTPSTTDPTPSSTQDNSTSNINNNINSDSQSGSATVADNQVGGSATSGNASSTATLINTVQSSAGSSSPVQTFTDNITGNQNGDVNIDPSLLSPNSGQTNTNPASTVDTTSSINNYLTLFASSGNATVENNGVGGNATTGSATTDANLINLIDSSINDQQTFLGLINIFGNLNGNIVIPQDLVNALINSPSSSTSSSPSSQVSNNFLINNNVTLIAQTGQAAVVSNGSAGNATSGNATTNLQLYNLINSQISGGNLLLVFVNVMGQWQGLLFNESAGTNSAVVGNGIQSSAICPTPTSVTSNETINNNLYLNATSGNALVTYNKQGGNATSGNATSSADIVNILGDQVNLSGWFGILVINVFGSWNGSLVAESPAVIVIPVNPTSPNTQISPSNTNSLSSGCHHHSYFSDFSAGPSSGISSTPTIFASTISSHSAALFTKAASNKIGKIFHGSLSHSLSFSLLGILFIVLAVALFVIDRVVTYKTR